MSGDLEHRDKNGETVADIAAELSGLED